MKLFENDNHFDDEVHLTKTTSHINLIDECLKAYTCLRPYRDDLYVIGGVNINSMNFKAGGHYIKLLGKSSENENFLKILPRINKKLITAGVPVANIMMSDKGMPYEDISVEGRSYYVLVQDFTSSSYFSGGISELEQAKQIIFTLCDCSDDLARIMKVDRTLNYDVAIDYLLDVISSLELKRSHDRFDSIVLEYAEDIKRLISNRKIILEESSLYHCDLHPHNILVDSSSIVAIVDLPSFVLMPRNVFIGFSLYKLARKSYCKGVIKAGELKEFSDYRDGALIELIRRISLIVELHYSHKDTRWDFDLPKQLIGLREVDILF